MGLLKLLNKNSTSTDPVFEAQMVVAEICGQISVLEAYLFGSAVSGNFNQDSDLDLLLVFSNDIDLRSASKLIYSKRWSKLPVDFILKSKSDFETRSKLGGVCFEAAHSGKRIL